MGWRTDQACDDAQRKDYKNWKASVTEAEYFCAMIGSYASMLAGAILALFFVFDLVVRLGAMTRLLRVAG